MFYTQISKLVCLHGKREVDVSSFFTMHIRNTNDLQDEGYDQIGRTNLAEVNLNYQPFFCLYGYKKCLVSFVFQ
jgi:hypothetical protein